MALPPALLAAIQAKAQGGMPPPGGGATTEPLNQMDGVKPKSSPSKSKGKSKKSSKKLTEDNKKAAIERKMAKNGKSSGIPSSSG